MPGTGREEPVAILCGGRGTRLQEHTHAIPKALVEIGGRPILWHVLRIYAAHGFSRFLLLCGYRGEMIADFAAGADLPRGIEVECLDTGVDTPTGGRVAAAADQLGAGTFALTYADGVADIDLSAALDYHRGHDAAATVTLVRPRSQWGIAKLDSGGSAVTGFVEKPRMEQWVNGGFLFCEPRVLGYTTADSALEHEPLERLAAAGELQGWRHEGFWDCMDTYKDAVVLDDLWATGSPPWRVWEDVPTPPRMKRALVTGGRGFVGAWLCWALSERGIEVTSFDRRGPHERPSTLTMIGLEGRVAELEGELLDGDLLRATLLEAGIDTVFHLAAETIVGTVQADPIAGFETNVRGTWTLLEACRAKGVERVVFASSDKAYGAHDELPYREDFALRPTAPYEASKAAADLIARSYWPAYGLPVAVTRFANIYGGGDLNFSRLVPEAVCAAIDGRPPVLRSDGTPIRDLLHVEDAAAAYLAIADALDRPDVRGEAFNAGGERPHSVLEIVAAITRLAGTGVEPEIRGEGNPDGEIDRQFVDATKLRERCGWKPSVSLEQGIERTLAWYRAHPEARPV